VITESVNNENIVVLVNNFKNLRMPLVRPLFMNDSFCKNMSALVRPTQNTDYLKVVAVDVIFVMLNRIDEYSEVGVAQVHQITVIFLCSFGQKYSSSPGFLHAA
jgi:hypothetical protein